MMKAMTCEVVEDMNHPVVLVGTVLHAVTLLPESAAQTLPETDSGHLHLLTEKNTNSTINLHRTKF